MDELLKRAINIATKAHEGQVDKMEIPYICHVLRVMEAGRTNDEKVLGALHDLVEDTEWTFEQLEQEFPKQIIDALRCLTKMSEDENYDEFIARIQTNSLATRVKINDIVDNLDIRRLDVLIERDFVRLKKYHTAYKKLIKTNEL